MAMLPQGVQFSSTRFTKGANRLLGICPILVRRFSGAPLRQASVNVASLTGKFAGEPENAVGQEAVSCQRIADSGTGAEGEIPQRVESADKGAVKDRRRYLIDDDRGRMSAKPPAERELPGAKHGRVQSTEEQDSEDRRRRTDRDRDQDE
jgi:hypothetical protein